MPCLESTSRLCSLGEGSDKYVLDSCCWETFNGDVAEDRGRSWAVRNSDLSSTSVSTGCLLMMEVGAKGDRWNTTGCDSTPQREYSSVAFSAQYPFSSLRLFRTMAHPPLAWQNPVAQGLVSREEGRRTGSSTTKLEVVDGPAVLLMITGHRRGFQESPAR
jgi:hypothetical protein